MALLGKGSRRRLAQNSSRSMGGSVCLCTTTVGFEAKMSSAHSSWHCPSCHYHYIMSDWDDIMAQLDVGTAGIVRGANWSRKSKPSHSSFCTPFSPSHSSESLAYAIFRTKPHMTNILLRITVDPLLSYGEILRDSSNENLSVCSAPPCLLAILPNGKRNSWRRKPSSLR